MGNRRRKYFVGEGDHRGILVIAGILMLALILIASGLFYVLADRDLENATYRAHFDTLRNTMQMLLPWLVIVNLIGLIVVLTLAVYLTHRISGPAYHLIKDLKVLGSGDLTISTKFRKHDRMKGVAEALSSAAAELRGVVADTKKNLADLSCRANKFPDLKGTIDEIGRNLDRLKT
jgi:methyl-accepting chemotaxis protein